MSDTDARLAFVAVTRARRHLDLGGLEWIEAYPTAANGRSAREKAQDPAAVGGPCAAQALAFHRDRPAPWARRTGLGGSLVGPALFALRAAVGHQRRGMRALVGKQGRQVGGTPPPLTELPAPDAAAVLPGYKGTASADAGSGSATATWTGMIAFGMVTIPVQLFAATEAHTVRLCVIDAADGSRVQHRRFCATWQLSPEEQHAPQSLTVPR